MQERKTAWTRLSFWIDRQAIYPYSYYREGEIQSITSGLKLENLENQRGRYKQDNGLEYE